MIDVVGYAQLGDEMISKKIVYVTVDASVAPSLDDLRALSRLISYYNNVVVTPIRALSSLPHHPTWREISRAKKIIMS